MGTGATAAGGASLLGSGAFTSVAAEREISVAVADDTDAFLRLAPCPDSPNGGYVDNSNGQLSIDLSGENSNDDPSGSGVNTNALSRFDSVFEIANQGTQDVCVDFAVEVPQIPDGANVPEGYDFGPGDPAVVFYRGSDRGRYVINNRLDTDRDGAIKLPIDNGSSECIGFEVRAFGFNAGENLFGGVDLTIHADADSDCRLGSADLSPGSNYVSEGPYRLRAVDIDNGDDISGRDGVTADLDLSPEGALEFDLATDGTVDGGAGLETAYGATGVNLDGIETIEIDVDFDAQKGGDLQSNFYVGVDEAQDDISRSTVRDGSVERSAVIGFDGDGKEEFEGTLELDVGGVNGRHDLGIGAQISTDFSEELIVTVDRVAFTNQEGSQFSLRLNSGLVPGFTSEGEYRSVAEDTAHNPSENISDNEDITAELTADGELNFDLVVETSDEVNANLEKTYGATGVNVDSLDTIEVDVDFDADDRDDGSFQSNFYVGIDQNRVDISRGTIRNNEVERAAVIGSDGNDEREFDGTIELDVSGLAGRRDVGIGAQISTSAKEELAATVDRVAFRRDIVTEFDLELDGGSN